MKSADAILKQIRTCSTVARWLLSDMLRHDISRLIPMLGLNVFSIATRASTIGLVLLFVHAQTTEKPTRILSIEVPSDASLATLLMWGISVVLVATVTGFTSYAGEVIAFSIARRVMERSLQRALKVVVRGQHDRNPLFEGEGAKANRRSVLLADTMFLLRATLLVTGSVLPMLMMLAAVSVLLYLNTTLTLIILALLGVYAVPLYLLNASVVGASRTYEEYRGQRSGLLGSLLQYASQTHCPGISRPAWTRLYFDNLPSQTTIRAWASMILSRRRVAFLQDVLLGVILCVILLVFGLVIARDPSSWTVLLTYIIALRYAVTGLSTTAASLTGFNRFLPQVERLRSFIDSDASRAEQAPAPPAPGSPVWTFHAADPRLPSTEDSRRLGPGDVALCLYPTPLETFTLIPFCYRLTRNSATGRNLFEQSFFCGHLPLLPPLSIGALATGRCDPDKDELDRVLSHLRALDLAEEIDRLPSGFDTIMTSKVYGSLSPPFSVAMLLMPGLLADRKTFIISWHAIAPLSEDDRSKLVGYLSDRMVLLVSPRVVPKLPAVADCSIVLDNDGIRGIGDADWHKSLDWDHLRRTVFSQAATAVADAGDEDMAEEF